MGIQARGTIWGRDVLPRQIVWMPSLKIGRRVCQFLHPLPCPMELAAVPHQPVPRHCDRCSFVGRLEVREQMVSPGLFFEDCLDHYRLFVLTCKFKYKLISFYFGGEKKDLVGKLVPR